MIAKQYRLTERELGKVLSRRKPFFSYQFIANVLTNRLPYDRVALLLPGKVARGSVNRNFWRRHFYTESSRMIYDRATTSNEHFDIVVVPKKGTILDKKNHEHLAEFEKNIQFLYRKITHS